MSINQLNNSQIISTSLFLLSALRNKSITNAVSTLTNKEQSLPAQARRQLSGPRCFGREALTNTPGGSPTPADSPLYLLRTNPAPSSWFYASLCSNNVVFWPFWPMFLFVLRFSKLAMFNLQWLWCNWMRTKHLCPKHRGQQQCSCLLPIPPSAF